MASISIGWHVIPSPGVLSMIAAETRLTTHPSALEFKGEGRENFDLKNANSRDFRGHVT